MENHEMDRLLALAKELWPRFEPTPVTGEAWGFFVSACSYQEVKAAMIVHKRESTDWQPDIGAIARLLEPEPPQVDDIIALCDSWYRRTDDNNRYPTRDDRDKYPLAAKVWALAGGYDALHDQEWAHQRLRSAYKEAMDAQGSHDAYGMVKAITAGEANAFMRQLRDRTSAMREIGA